MAIHKTEVVREFPAIGKYRIRLLTKGEKRFTLDLREYVSAEAFEGFTRRGLHLSSHAEVVQLRDTLNEVIASGAFDPE